MSNIISNKVKKELNRMNRAADDAQLGTVIQNLMGSIGFSGSTVVTTAMMSASRVAFLNTNTTTGFDFMALRSGSVLTNYGVSIWNAGSLVLNAFSGSMLPNDQIYVQMW